MYRFTRVIFFLVFGFSSFAALAQKPELDWTVGVDAGFLIFYGDVKQNDFIPVFRDNNEVKPGYGLNIRKRFNPFLGIQLKFLRGTLAGTQRERNEYFKTNIFSWSINADININQIIFYDQDQKDLELYLQLGAGLVDFRGKLFNLQTNDIIAVNGYSADGKNKEKATTELIIPFGIGGTYGLRHFLKEEHVFWDRLDIVVEFTWVFTNTDKIDMVQSYRSGKDQYSFACFGFHYNFK